MREHAQNNLQIMMDWASYVNVIKNNRVLYFYFALYIYI